DHQVTHPPTSAAHRTVPFAVPLLKSRSVLALVLVARAVAVLVIVVAFAVALRADRVEALAIAPVVSSDFDAVAIAVLRRRRGIADAAQWVGRVRVRVAALISAVAAPRVP